MNNDVSRNNTTGDFRINNKKTTISRSFECKAKIIGSTTADKNTLDREIIVSLKYLSNFWRSLDLPLINWQIELDLTYT